MSRLRSDSGLHALADILGVTWGQCRDGSAGVRLMDSPLLDDPDAALLAVGVAADLAGASAARTRLTPGARLATTFIALHLFRNPVPGPVQVAASLSGADRTLVGDTAFAAHADVDDGDGTCAAALVAGRALPGSDLPPLAWEHPETAADLAARTPVDPATMQGVPLSRWLLAGTSKADGAGFTVPVAERAQNRVGHLQGGAVLAVADRVARLTLGATVGRVRAVTWRYRAPIQDSATYEVDSFDDPRAAHVHVRASERGRLCGVGTFEYERRSTQ